MTTALTGTPAITAISAALLGYKATAMTTLTGALTKGAAEDQTFTFTSPNSTTVTSTARMVYAGGESTTSIKITSVTIGGETRSIPAPVQFNQKLDPGKSYTLRVSFKKQEWAKSNIYWVKTGSDANGDIGYLTFDTTDKGHQGYQGVFFQWGSLVGISPARTNGSDAFSNATPVYIPTYVAGGTSTWHSPTTSPYTTAGWPFAINSTVAEDAPENIPYMDNRAEFIAPSPARTNIYVMEAERNTDAMYSAKRGDICQYLGKTQTTLKGYRLPRSSEMTTQNSTTYWYLLTDGWEKGIDPFSGSDASVGKADGTADLVALNKSYAKNSTLGVTLPASGCRTIQGPLQDIGSYGHYMSGSATGANDHYNGLTFDNQYCGTYVPYRSYALPIRCVKN
jgi:hypothetical protein